MPDANGLLTYDDLLATPEDGRRYEIFDGVLEVSPAPRVRHQEIVAEIFFALQAHIKAHGGGRVLPGPVGMRLSEHNILEPDIAFVADDRLSVIDPRFIDGPPSLVVEVVSESRRDRIQKRDTYERFRVPQYWIADPEADRIEVLLLRDGRYTKPEIFEPGDTLTTDLLPGLSIDIAEIFRR